MHLTPREKDKLLVAMAAVVARRRLGRGLKLCCLEGAAPITDCVADMACVVEVAGSFLNDTKLVTVHQAIR